MDLPSGTVTFLFSDIEGSTRHAHRLGDERWSALLREHDALVDGVIERRGGVVVKHEGDGTFAAFPEARPAIDAAVAIERGLADGALGDARDRDPRPDRPAHGRRPRDRVPASTTSASTSTTRPVSPRPATADRSSSRMPRARRQVGDGRLGPRRRRRVRRRGAAQAQGLRRAPRRCSGSSFPASSTTTARSGPRTCRANLPALTTRFVGREAEIDRLSTLLATTRLLTLTGPGGTGKTRLGIGLATAIRPGSGGGTWFVDLAPVRDPELVIGIIATTLGLREEPGVPVATTLREHLRRVDALLVLDNLEQLLPRPPRRSSPRCCASRPGSV